MMHTFVKTRSDRNSCVTNERELEREKFKPCLLSPLCTPECHFRLVCGKDVGGGQGEGGFRSCSSEVLVGLLEQL